jgi:hypothetical protein
MTIFSSLVLLLFWHQNKGYILLEGKSNWKEVKKAKDNLHKNNMY